MENQRLTEGVKKMFKKSVKVIKKENWIEFQIEEHYDLYNFFFLWRCDPTRVMASSFLRFLDHTQ
jgi:hypothetical protein